MAAAVHFHDAVHLEHEDTPKFTVILKTKNSFGWQRCSKSTLAIHDCLEAIKDWETRGDIDLRPQSNGEKQQR